LRGGRNLRKDGSNNANAAAFGPEETARPRLAPSEPVRRPHLNGAAATLSPADQIMSIPISQSVHEEVRLGAIFWCIVVPLDPLHPRDPVGKTPSLTAHQEILIAVGLT